MVQNVVICQTEYVNASRLYAIYASIGFTESRSCFENGSWFLNQRTFQICNTQIRMLKFDEQIVEQVPGVAFLKI